MKPLLALSLCLSGVPWFTAAEDGLYTRKESLAETMRATRSNYEAWRGLQTPARAAVTCSPWTLDGTPQPGWKDGALILLSEDPACQAVTLRRTLTSREALQLTVGCGGGDRLEMALNGQVVARLNTHLECKRYGTAMRLEGDRRNQALVHLPVPRGESVLEVRLRQEVVGARHLGFQFFFSTAPDPVPGWWQRLRCDFPPRTHPFWEAASHRWFAPGGWFEAGTHTRLEEELLASVQAPAGTPASLEACFTAAERDCVRRDLDRLAQAVDALGRAFPEEYPAAAFRQRLAQVQTTAEADRCRRLMLVEANPLLRGRKILFARRHTYDSQHYYDDYYHGPSAWGGNLTELDLTTGQTRDLAPALNGGIFDRFDLSPDARRVVFGYRPCKPDGYRIWETGVDGTGLRQLTFPPADEAERIARHSAYSLGAMKKDPRLYGHWTDDMHPCYLPDGGIALVSSRSESSVLCGDHALTCTTLHRMDANGGHLHALSQGALTESTPTLLDDGRILYTRWEYVYKGIAAVQSLWAVRPDGTGSEEVYGLNIDNPGVFFAGRQIPGRPDLLVAAGVGHEPLGVGSIRVIDRTADRRTKAAMSTLTPEVETRGLRGLFQFRNGQWVEDVTGSFYCDPFPLDSPAGTDGLAGQFFLVSHTPDQRYNDPKAYGIWLLDGFGNRVLLYQDPEMSCFQPMLLSPRPTAPVLPASTTPAQAGTASRDATVLLVDLYHNLDGVQPGTVKYLRVMEQIPRSWAASQIHPGDSVPGQSPAISLHTHIWVAVLLGIVPVEADGSALFNVPSQRNLFVAALDQDFMEVQKMRSFVNFQPGEVRSCTGCHDARKGTPRVERQPLALLAPPREIDPQPGDAGPRPIHYPTDVQPILDRHCVRCHHAGKLEGKVDLSGALTEHFSRSYETLLRQGLVPFIQEWTGPVADKRGPLFVSNGSMMHAEAVPPYTYGSHRSKLVALLRKGHYDAQLSREEFIRLVTWVDANAPYYGSYFGRRNVLAKDQPGFRPQPTLDSARGIPPSSSAPPLPATLLASWNESSLPARFDGRQIFQGSPAGVQEAVSVALWVRPDSLAHTWNPLLFTDGSGLSSFHFSLLEDGTPNVAINCGDKHWVHQRASDPVTSGAWHHVAVVCDPRPGGEIRFFLDGIPAGIRPLDLGIPLDLTAYRLGAWRNWERQPACNFHGQLAQVRLYRGLLTAAEVAALAHPDCVPR